MGVGGDTRAEGLKGGACHAVDATGRPAPRVHYGRARCIVGNEHPVYNAPCSQCIGATLVGPAPPYSCPRGRGSVLPAKAARGAFRLCPGGLAPAMWENNCRGRRPRTLSAQSHKLHVGRVSAVRINICFLFKKKKKCKNTKQNVYNERARLWATGW